MAESLACVASETSTGAKIVEAEKVTVNDIAKTAMTDIDIFHLISDLFKPVLIRLFAKKDILLPVKPRTPRDELIFFVLHILIYILF